MNPLEQYEMLLKEAAPTAAKYIEDADERVADLCKTLRQERIRVMIFGAYNAGKSTLVNALLGGEHALVGDVPTTDVVNEYEWDGHILLDTPGVNAPIAHEEVSREELERADLVLFILRQEDQDAADVMRRIFDLLEADRPLFLLLNYSDSDPESISNVQLSMNRTLIRHAELRGYDLDEISRVPVVMINARTALKARLENKTRLREHSGFDDFILRFTGWLREYDGKTEFLEVKRGAIERVLLEPVRLVMKNQPASHSEGEELLKQISHLQRERLVLRDMAQNRVRTELSLRRPALAAALDQGGDEQAVIATVTKVADEVAQIVNDWLDKEVDAVLERSIGNLLDSGGVDVPKSGRTNGSSSGDKYRDVALEGLKRSASKENIAELLKLGRSLKIPWLKGKWGKTLDKWAGKAAPVIQVFMAAVEVGVAHRDEQRDNQQALDRTMQRNQWVDEVCAQIQAGLTQSIDAALQSLFDELLEPLMLNKEALNSAADELGRDRLAWDDLANKFQEVRY